MRVRGLAGLTLLVIGVGCRFDPSGVPPSVDGRFAVDSARVDLLGPDGVSAPDAASDLAAEGPLPDGPPATEGSGIICSTWTPKPRHFDPCQIPLPGADLSLGAGVWVYDTTSGTLTDPSQQPSTPPSQLVAGARVLSVQSFTVASGAELRVSGDHPLLVASWSTITIDGTIDVASRAERGAGSNPPDCASHAATDGQGKNGTGGGGGGGGFGGAGGDGGDGNNDKVNGGNGGTKIPAPTMVRGGCDGGKGGEPEGGNGGKGGGALQLTAQQAITVNGVLHAGGGRGRGGDKSESGGGGGGSGGYLGLQAPQVTLTPAAVLAANGGGGGEGASGSSQGNGGEHGQPAAQPASGGSGGTSQGGDGGDGGWRDAPDGKKGSKDQDGGGGGGGGVGFVLVSTPSLGDQGATASPKLTLQP